MAGYSGTPLPKKLGLKDGQRVGWIALPEECGALPTSRDFAAAFAVPESGALPEGPFDVIHLFTRSRSVLEVAVPNMLSRLHKDGMIWVSWPKKASKVPTDVTEDTIRAVALSGVLVDVKVCAVDDIWSGLKLVIRKELRAGHAQT